MKHTYETPKTEVVMLFLAMSLLCASGGRNDYDQEDW